MAVPGSFLDRFSTTVDKIAATLPVIKSTADSVSTVINGQPRPDSTQQNPSVQALVPRNVGGLDLGTAGTISSTMLVVGLAAIAAVFFLAKRR